MKKIIVALFLIALVGCKNYVSIDQSAEISSYIDNSDLVVTKVWVRNCIGYGITLEYWEVVKCNYPQIDSVKSAQRRIADSIATQLEPLINN